MAEVEIPKGIPQWHAVLFDGRSLEFAHATETMFRLAIEPSCLAIAAELSAIDRDAQNSEWEGLRVAQLEMQRSFALALGGLWERNFRQHLEHSMPVIGPKNKQVALRKAHWKEFKKLFEACRGFSLERFRSYSELELLYLVSNAVRHGDGDALDKLFDRHPDLFLDRNHAITNWYAYFTLGGVPANSIRNLEITAERLGAFKDAIVDFWMTIAALQKTDKS